MAKSITIKPMADGGWVGYLSPVPKMPTPDSVQKWKDFETMVAALKAMQIRIIVTGELKTRLKEAGVELHPPARTK